MRAGKDTGDGISVASPGFALRIGSQFWRWVLRLTPRTLDLFLFTVLITLLGGCTRMTSPRCPNYCASDGQDGFCRLCVFAPLGQGGISDGDLFVNNFDRAIYRVWDSAHPLSRLGNWWAPDPPPATEEQFLQKYVVCHGWGAHARLTRCILKRDAVVAKGSGAAGSCAKESQAIQLYVPYPSEELEHCVDVQLPWYN